MSAVSNSTVPKVTLIVGHSFGAGRLRPLCGKAFDPRFIFAWPGARYAVMGAHQAARTMLDVNVGTLKRQGRQIDDDELAAMAEELRLRYDRETDRPLRRCCAAVGRLDHRPSLKPATVLSMASMRPLCNREPACVHWRFSGLISVRNVPQIPIPGTPLDSGDTDSGIPGTAYLPPRGPIRPPDSGDSGDTISGGFGELRGWTPSGFPGTI